MDQTLHVAKKSYLYYEIKWLQSAGKALFKYYKRN